MIELIKDKWTIVIVGGWNPAIFNTPWLKKNLFNDPEIIIEVGLEPGLPRRITGDKVLIIPTDSRIIFAPVDLNDENILRVEQVAIKTLELLNQTPINAVGVNFGYKVRPLTEYLQDKLPIILGEKLADEKLIVTKREYKWSSPFEDGILNTDVKITGEEAEISFNFNMGSSEIDAAIKYLKDKVISNRDKTRFVLANVFNLNIE